MVLSLVTFEELTRRRRHDSLSAAHNTGSPECMQLPNLVDPVQA
jgi:hypothetical protein